MIKINSKHYSLLRFLVLCSWNDSDREGWIDFIEEDENGEYSPRGAGLVSKISDEDIDTFDDLEEMALIENRGTGLYPSIRINSRGWKVVSIVSGIRYNLDPGWRNRRDPHSYFIDIENKKIIDQEE
jgi:hypothetical protein